MTPSGSERTSTRPLAGARRGSSDAQSTTGTTSSAWSRSTVAGSPRTTTVTVGGRARSFSSYDPGPGAAVVIALHGRYGDGARMAALTRLVPRATGADGGPRFGVVFPDGVEASWNDARRAGPAAEAGVDDFRIVEVDCTPDATGDVDGDGVVDANDLAALLAAWGTKGGPAGLNGDGIVDSLDLAIVLAGWTF